MSIQCHPEQRVFGMVAVACILRLYLGRNLSFTPAEVCSSVPLVKRTNVFSSDIAPMQMQKLMVF